MVLARKAWVIVSAIAKSVVDAIVITGPDAELLPIPARKEPHHRNRAKQTQEAFPLGTRLHPASNAGAQRPGKAEENSHQTPAPPDAPRQEHDFERVLKHQGDQRRSRRKRDECREDLHEAETHPAPFRGNVRSGGALVLEGGKERDEADG